METDAELVVRLADEARRKDGEEWWRRIKWHLEAYDVAVAFSTETHSKWQAVRALNVYSEEFKYTYYHSHAWLAPDYNFDLAWAMDMPLHEAIDAAGFVSWADSGVYLIRRK